MPSVLKEREMGVLVILFVPRKPRGTRWGGCRVPRVPTSRATQAKENVVGHGQLRARGSGF